MPPCFFTKEKRACMCEGFLEQTKQNAMSQRKNKKYLQKNIIATLSLTGNAPAFLVMKQCKREEGRASKQWRMLEDYRQLNWAIMDNTLETLSVS
jgi:hypothetical protein